MNLPINHNSTIRGIVILLIATVVFAFQDAVTKELIQSMPTAQLVFIRVVVFSMFAAIYVQRKVGVTHALQSHATGRQILRTVIMCSEISLFAFALRTMGIAEMHAIFTCFPLIITALSVPMLNESVGWRRWIAVSIGFAGTLIILRPGSGVSNLYAVFPLMCAVLYSIYTLLTRQVSKVDSFETSLLYFGFVGVIAMSVPAMLSWAPIPAENIPALALLCLLSVTGHWMLIKALELAEAVVLQPFNYLILVWAAIFGYIFYGELLDRWQIIGACIVVASGIYIGRREYLTANES